MKYEDYRKSLDNIGEYFEHYENWELMKDVQVITELIDNSKKQYNEGFNACLDMMISFVAQLRESK